VTLARARRRRIAADLGAACLVATAAVLGMIGQGDFSAPPRYDGAGYAVLARSLAEGTGYRAIDHPDRPRHAHFPPGYPVFLAVVRRAFGASALAAHLASSLCTLGATLLAWWWFRRMFSPGAALALGLSLGINWAWARTGTAIQSEPLYSLLGQGAIVVATASGPVGLLGALIAACVLTRQIAIGLVAAVLLDLLIRGRRQPALAAALVAALLVGPWLVWIAVAGGEQGTQAGLLVSGNADLAPQIAARAVFYFRRIPDQIVGPVVEVATTIRRTPAALIAANSCALLGTGVILLGWIRAIRRPRRRLAGLIPVLTLVLLLAWPSTEAGRFLDPLIPCLLVGAAEGLIDLFGRLTRRSGSRIPRRRLALLAAVVVLLVSVPYSAYAIVTGRSRMRDAANRDFDAACAWLARDGSRPGPVLSRHPGEVFLATGRQALEVPTSERPGEADASADEVARAIAKYHVAYLVLDVDRYVGAPRGPLARFVIERSGRVRKVWSQERGSSGAVIYEVVPDTP
jgi:hypothetical protein